MKRFAIAALVLLYAGAVAGAPRKLVRHPRTGITGEYIVVLNDNVPSTAVEGLAKSLAASYALEVDTVWEYSLRGFLAKGAEENAAALAADPRVKFIEQNFTTEGPKMSATQWTYFNGEYMSHLDRVDEIDGTTPDGQHNMCTEGRDMYAYVIDTGVQRDHPQFENPTRVVTALDFSDDRSNLNAVFTNDDTNGCTTWPFGFENSWHGTAVASVLGGTQVGVAKPSIVSLKVARCGSIIIRTADLIDAVNWINSPNNPWRGQSGVINHSGYVPRWGDDADPVGNDFSAYSNAVENLVNQTSLPFFTSADNWSTDACLFSPNDRARTYLRAGTVFVVGGSSAGGTAGDTRDYRYQEHVVENNVTLYRIGRDSGSNAGACVSIYAPATRIYSARNSSFRDPDDGLQKLYDRESGTSFASPLVAGIAARYIQRQRQNTGITPGAQAVYTFLLNTATSTIQNAATPAYWYCAPHQTGGEVYRSNPPATCDPFRWGQNGPGTAPYFFPSVGNDSGARHVYFDEGFCPPPGGM